MSGDRPAAAPQAPVKFEIQDPHIKKYEAKGSLKAAANIPPPQRESSEEEDPAEESVEQRLGRASNYLNEFENEKKEGYGLSDHRKPPSQINDAPKPTNFTQK